MLLKEEKAAEAEHGSQFWVGCYKTPAGEMPLFLFVLYY